jgi:conjugative relaxase-like TrwC/TraI family protein
MAGNAKTYYTGNLGADDYYTKGCDPPGTFHGSALKDLGLKDGQRVTQEAFCNLWDGLTPDGKQRLIQHQRGRAHRGGWDCVFTLDKAGSLAYARMTPEERAIADEKLAAKVNEVMGYFERSFATSRVGKGGEERVKAKLIWGDFGHITARTQDTDTPDPHWHHHCTVFNVSTRDRGNGWVDSGTIESKAFYTRQRLLSALWDTGAAQVFREMGYLTAGHGKDAKLEAVPKDLCEEFSKRHEAIEQARAGRKGHAADRRAWNDTREAKKHVPRAELFSHWQKDFDQRGFTQDAFHRHRKRRELVNVVDEVTGALDRAAKNLTKHQSYFTEARYLEEVCTEARGKGIAVDVLIDAVKYRLQNKSLMVELGKIGDDVYHTTAEMMEAEKKYLGLLESVKGKNAYQVRGASVLQAIRETEEAESKKQGKEVKLTSEQVGAVFRFTRGEDGIATLTGDAGTGKSLCCSAVRRAFELDGYKVIGCAVAKKAAINLEESSGIKSYSVAKLIGSEELGFKGDLDQGILDQAKHAVRQIGKAAIRSVCEDLKHTPIIGRLVPRAGTPTPYQPVTVDEKTVVILDEAGLVGTREMTSLIEKVVSERGGRLCLVGDAKQLSPISPGNAFKAATAVLDPKEESRLTRINRQRAEEDQEAVRAIARGDAKEAFDSYVKRGLLHIGNSQNDAMRQMVADWKMEGLKNQKENLLLCATNKERFELCRLAQAEMKRAGLLGKKGFTAGGEDFHRGDRIMFTKNSQYGVQNGSMGTIQRIGTKRLTRAMLRGKQFTSLWSMLKYAEAVKKDNALWMTVKLDGGEIVDIPLERYRNFRLGYALNTYQAQGQTVDNVFVLSGGAFGLDREQVYVQASRSRNSPRIYTGAINTERGRPHVDTVAELAKRASKSRAKELAHDVKEKAHAKAGMQTERLRLRIQH